MTDNGIRAFDVLHDLEKVRAVRQPGERLDAIRDAVPGLRSTIKATGEVLGVRTFNIARYPYPTRFALWNATSVPVPYVLLTQRSHAVRFTTGDGEPKTLLFNPTDAIASAETPFFRQLRDQYGKFLSDTVLSKRWPQLAEQVESSGIPPSKVDYVAFDHLHTQDLRPIAKAYPNATILLRRDEAESLRNLHPIQANWYVKTGLDGVSKDRIRMIDDDVLLGNGVALIATPGHTLGNQTLAMHTSEGLHTVSENGVAADAYSPRFSKIPGVQRYAEEHGYEVILNANTLEGSADQYNSMVLERDLADPNRRVPAFHNAMPSSELTPSRIAPGLRPTFEFGELTLGTV